MNKRLIHLFLSWIFPVLLALFLIQIAFGSVVFYFYTKDQTRTFLLQEIERVKEDIKYVNGKWDTSQYNADGNVPSINPLYIITSDGFVIDRWRPIHGLLDASEFTRILTYTNPQTINTITNENWRVLSQSIISDKEVVGVILVTAYQPDQNNLESIDSQLQQTVVDIQKTISVQGETVNVSKLDPRKLPFNITYQIVNKFNKIIALSDNVNSITRTPTFIDTSYVDNQLRAKSEEQVIDSTTKKSYLVETSPLYSANKEIIGMVVAGAEIDSLYANFSLHLFSFAIVSIVLLVLISPFLLYILDVSIKESLQSSLGKKDPKKIVFFKQESLLQIDEARIQIPYASYQFYFCAALFSKPQKRWETDELIEQFGGNIEKEGWRKVYDTMVALNKKVSTILPDKLFIVSDKTYRINPYFLTKITDK